jgi:hypothetical protein
MWNVDPIQIQKYYENQVTLRGRRSQTGEGGYTKKVKKIS